MAKAPSLSRSSSRPSPSRTPFKRQRWEIDYRDAVHKYGAGYVENSLRRGIASCMDRLMEHTLECTAAEYRACVTALTDLLLLRLLHFNYEAARVSGVAGI